MDPGSPRSAARTLEDPPLPRGVSRPGLPLELPGAEVVYSKTQNPLLDVARNAELRAELAAGGPLAGASHADLTMEGGGARSGGALRRNIGFDVRKYKAQVRPVPESYIEKWSRILATAPGTRKEADLEELDWALGLEVEALRKLPRDLRLRVYQNATLATLPAGDAVIEQGEVGDEFYVLLKGLLLVQVRVEMTRDLADIRKIDTENMVRVTRNAQRRLSRVERPDEVLRHLRRPSSAGTESTRDDSTVDTGDDGTSSTGEGASSSPKAPLATGEGSAVALPGTNGPLDPHLSTKAVVVNTINLLGPLTGFGDRALEESDHRRKASVVAAEDSVLLCLAGTHYRAVMRDFRRRLVDEAFALLRRVSFLAPWKDEHVRLLATAVERRVFQPGEVVLHQGAPPEGIFIVMRGQAHLSRSIPVPDLLSHGARILARGRRLIRADGSAKTNLLPDSEGEESPSSDEGEEESADERKPGVVGTRSGRGSGSGSEEEEEEDGEEDEEADDDDDDDDDAEEVESDVDGALSFRREDALERPGSKGPASFAVARVSHASHGGSSGTRNPDIVGTVAPRRNKKEGLAPLRVPASPRGGAGGGAASARGFGSSSPRNTAPNAPPHGGSASGGSPASARAARPGTSKSGATSLSPTHQSEARDRVPELPRLPSPSPSRDEASAAGRPRGLPRRGHASSVASLGSTVSFYGSEGEALNGVVERAVKHMRARRERRSRRLQEAKPKVGIAVANAESALVLTTDPDHPVINAQGRIRAPAPKKKKKKKNRRKEKKSRERADTGLVALRSSASIDNLILGTHTSLDSYLPRHPAPSASGAAAPSKDRKPPSRRRGRRLPLRPGMSKEVDIVVRELQAADGFGLVDLLAAYAAKCLPPPGASKAAESTKNDPFLARLDAMNASSSRSGGSGSAEGENTLTEAIGFAAEPQTTRGRRVSVGPSFALTGAGGRRRRSMDWGNLMSCFTLSAVSRLEVLFVPRASLVALAMDNADQLWTSLSVAAEELPDDDLIRAKYAQAVAWDAYKLIELARTRHSRDTHPVNPMSGHLFRGEAPSARTAHPRDRKAGKVEGGPRRHKHAHRAHQPHSRSGHPHDEGDGREGALGDKQVAGHDELDHFDPSERGGGGGRAHLATNPSLQSGIRPSKPTLVFRADNKHILLEELEGLARDAASLATAKPLWFGHTLSASGLFTKVAKQERRREKAAVAAAAAAASTTTAAPKGLSLPPGVKEAMIPEALRDPVTTPRSPYKAEWAAAFAAGNTTEDSAAKGRPGSAARPKSGAAVRPGSAAARGAGGRRGSNAALVAVIAPTTFSLSDAAESLTAKSLQANAEVFFHQRRDSMKRRLERGLATSSGLMPWFSVHSEATETEGMLKELQSGATPRGPRGVGKAAANGPIDRGSLVPPHVALRSPLSARARIEKEVEDTAAAAAAAAHAKAGLDGKSSTHPARPARHTDDGVGALTPFDFVVPMVATAFSETRQRLGIESGPDGDATPRIPHAGSDVWGLDGHSVDVVSPRWVRLKHKGAGEEVGKSDGVVKAEAIVEGRNARGKAKTEGALETKPSPPNLLTRASGTAEPINLPTRASGRAVPMLRMHEVASGTERGRPAPSPSRATPQPRKVGEEGDEGKAVNGVRGVIVSAREEVRATDPKNEGASVTGSLTARVSAARRPGDRLQLRVEMERSRKKALIAALGHAAPTSSSSVTSKSVDDRHSSHTSIAPSRPAGSPSGMSRPGSRRWQTASPPTTASSFARPDGTASTTDSGLPSRSPSPTTRNRPPLTSASPVGHPVPPASPAHASLMARVRHHLTSIRAVEHVSILGRAHGRGRIPSNPGNEFDDGLALDEDGDPISSARTARFVIPTSVLAEATDREGGARARLRSSPRKTARSFHPRSPNLADVSSAYLPPAMMAVPPATEANTEEKMGGDGGGRGRPVATPAARGAAAKLRSTSPLVTRGTAHSETFFAEMDPHREEVEVGEEEKKPRAAASRLELRSPTTEEGLRTNVDQAALLKRRLQHGGDGLTRLGGIVLRPADLGTRGLYSPFRARLRGREEREEGGDGGEGETKGKEKRGWVARSDGEDGEDGERGVRPSPMRGVTLRMSKAIGGDAGDGVGGGTTMPGLTAEEEIRRAEVFFKWDERLRTQLAAEFASGYDPDARAFTAVMGRGEGKRKGMGGRK